MDINRLTALCGKYSRIERHIVSLKYALSKTEKEINECVLRGGSFPSPFPSTDYLVINGLKWDKENLAVGGTVINSNHYYTFDEAQEAAKKVGKRCPTAEEFDALIAIGTTWDDEKKGIWVAGNHDTDHKGSLFFPAAGVRYFGDGSLYNSPSYGYYWASSPYDSGSDDGGGLYMFSSGGVNPRGSSNRANGFSVRYISEFKK